MKIQYRFIFSDGIQEEFDINLGCEPQSLWQAREDLPEWTELSVHQCPHCPLDSTKIVRCPVAANIADIIKRFDSIVSHKKVKVEVTTPDRMYSNDTTVQRGLSSLLGLVFATSGCPHLDFFRPMARFHLPLATEEETIYRVASMFLVGQYLRAINKGDESITLDGLTERYKKVEIINLHIAKRLRDATSQDATVNALVILDFFAKTMPYVIHDNLESLNDIFAYYLDTES